MRSRLRRAGASLLLCAVLVSTADGQALATQQRGGDAGSLLERPARLVAKNVTLEQALNGLGERSGVGVSFSPSLIQGHSRRVDCDCANATVAEALDRLLAGTPAGYFVVHEQIVVAPVRQPPAAAPVRSSTLIAGRGALVTGLRPVGLAAWSVQAQGAVAGRVTAAETGEPLEGVAVSLEGTGIGMLTGPDGEYRLSPVPAGSYTLVAALIGRERVTRAVTVRDGEARVDIALRMQALLMDEIIVAGTVVQTRRRESPVPVAVLSADRIQLPSRNTIDQVFRGDVPGTIGLNNGAATTGGSYMFVRGKASLDADNLVKVYVDGVELPSTSLISTVDMQNVERMELLRGPQASTVYGSNASGGVLLIFTKQGSAGGPRLSGSTAFGTMSSDFVSGTPYAMEHRLNVSGGGQGFTYSLGGSYLGNGEVLEQADSRQGAVNAHTTFVQGPLHLSTSLAYSQRQVGAGNPPLLAAVVPDFSRPRNTDVTTKHQLLGASATYAPTDRWQTTLTIGGNRIAYEVDQWKARLAAPDDTLLNAYLEEYDQLSARLNSTLRADLMPGITSTTTAGIDLSRGSTSWYDTYSMDPASGGSTAWGYVAANRTTRNAGYFLQEVLGVHDRLFVTGAVRAESNSNFGDDGLVWAPRAGLAYVLGGGDVAVKPRVSYGKSLRPPQPGQAEGGVSDLFFQLPNPGLRPEIQNGYDLGFDLDAFGGRLGLEATYFDQTADDLISLYIDYTTSPFTSQYQNMAKVANRGLELGLVSSFGPVGLRGAYTYTKSEVIELAEGYGGDLEVGDRPLYVPAHTAGATLTLDVPALGAVRTAGRSARLEFGVTYIGERTSEDLVGIYRCIIDGEPEGCIPTFRAHWIELPAFVSLRAGFSHPLRRELELFANVDNLTDRQEGEIFNYAPSRGRTILVGLRFGR